MLYATLAACAVLTLVVILAVPHTKDRRLARLRAAQEKWAEAMDRIAERS